MAAEPRPRISGEPRLEGSGQLTRETLSQQPSDGSAGSACLSVAELAAQASTDAALREVLLEVALQKRPGWSAAGAEVASAVRWLLAQGLLPTPRHCRRVALLHGGLAPLQVLLVEAAVDVRGLELLVAEERWMTLEATEEQADRAGAPVSSRARAVDVARRATAAGSIGQPSNSGWVQRCKPALKALLARGAILGTQTSSKSKLLKRLEEDGNFLWAQRALDGLRRDQPDIPEPILCRIGDFAGVLQSGQHPVPDTD